MQVKLNDSDRWRFHSWSCLNAPGERRGVALLASPGSCARVLSCGTVVSSRSATDAAIRSVSEVYLEELSDRVAAHYEANIESKFAQLDTLGTSLDLLRPETADQVAAVLMTQQNDQYLFSCAEPAMEATAPRGGACDSLAAGNAATQSISELRTYDSGSITIMRDDAVILVDAIPPITCGSVTYTMAIASFDASAVRSDRLRYDERALAVERDHDGRNLHYRRRPGRLGGREQPVRPAGQLFQPRGR